MFFRTITLAAFVFSCALSGMERPLSSRPVTATLFNFLPKQFIAALEQKQTVAAQEAKPLMIPEQPKQIVTPEEPKLALIPEEPRQPTVMEQICNLINNELMDPIEKDEEIAALYSKLSKKCQELIALRPQATIHFEMYRDLSNEYLKKAQAKRDAIRKKQLREELRPKIDALSNDETLEKQRRLCLTVKLLTQLKAATEVGTQEFEKVDEELADATLHQKRTIFKNQVAICRQKNCIPELCTAYEQLVDLYPHQRKYYETKLSESKMLKQYVENIEMARTELADTANKPHANDAAKFDKLASIAANMVPLYVNLKAVDLEMYKKFYKEQHLETIDQVRSLRGRQASVASDALTRERAQKQVEQYRALYAKTNQE